MKDSYIFILISFFLVTACGRNTVKIQQKNSSATTSNSQKKQTPNNNKEESEDQEEEIIAEVPVVISGSYLVCHSTKSDSEADAKLTCKYTGSPEGLKDAIKNDTLVIVTSDFKKIKLSVGKLDESSKTITFNLSQTDHNNLLEEVKVESNKAFDIITEEEAAAIAPDVDIKESNENDPIEEQQEAEEQQTQEQVTQEDQVPVEETAGYDETKWAIDGSDIILTSGALQCSGNGESNYSSFKTISDYNFTQGSLQVDIVNMVTISELSSQALIWGLQLDIDNRAHFLIEGNTLIARHFNAGSYLDIATRTYDPNLDKYLKISHTIAGNIEFELSSNKTDWTIFASTPVVWSVANLSFEYSCGAWAAYTGNFSSTIDNFRIDLPEDPNFPGPTPPEGDITEDFINN